MKWVYMAEQPHTSLRSPCAMPSVGGSVVKLAAIGLWSSRNVISGVMNHATPSDSPTVESWFVGYSGGKGRQLSYLSKNKDTLI